MDIKTVPSEEGEIMDQHDSQVNDAMRDNDDTGMPQVSAEKDVVSQDGLALLTSISSELSGFKDRFVEMTGRVEHHANEMNKLYHNEFSGRLQGMQAEIEKYRERDEDRIYDGILIELALLCSRNIDIVDIDDEAKIKKCIGFLFEDLLSLLRKYNVEKLESNPGDKRNTRHCKVIGIEETNDKALHDTVARSRSVGFHSGNRTLVKENVDVFVYKENTDVNSSNN